MINQDSRVEYLTLCSILQRVMVSLVDVVLNKDKGGATTATVPLTDRYDSNPAPRGHLVQLDSFWPTSTDRRGRCRRTLRDEQSTLGAFRVKEGYGARPGKARKGASTEGRRS